MTPDEFKDALKKLGWSQADFCRMADVEKSTPYRWVSGITPIPGWAIKFLELCTVLREVAARTYPPKD